MPTRTSSRHAAQKAKEAIAASPDTKRRGSVGAKRKGSVSEKGPEPKREKKGAEEDAGKHGKPEPQQEPQQAPEEKKAGEKKVTQPEEKPAEKAEEKPAEEAEAKPEEQAKVKPEEAEEKPQEKPAPASGDNAESGLKKTQEREEAVPSNILEKGVIYFFYRARVNVQEPESIQDVARSFFVLRPTPIGASLDSEQGAVDTGAKCRLLMLPKKEYPRSGREREMAFVEKAGISMKEIQESFIPGESYDTATRGAREVPEAKPYAEGVYAITSTKRATHLVYILTLPEKLGDVQEDFGLSERGSWLIQSKNPKFPGPPSGRLPKEPEFPEHVQEKFRDLRWIPMEPELLDYPNAQVLMIGSAAGELGKAATADGDKRPEEEQPEEELVKMEEENEDRIETLGGDHAVYKDLGYDAQKHPKLVTTWDAGQQ